MKFTDLINIHNFISIDIDNDFPWKSNWIKSFADIISINKHNTTRPYVCLKVIYSKLHSGENMRKVSKFVYVGKHSLLDMKYRVMFELQQRNNLVLKTDNSSMEWFIWGLQLSLLVAGTTFVHGAAVEKEGKVFLFPSRGGVGKTALVNGFVKEHGWNILGDDLVILSSDAYCYGFPKPLVIYAYHNSLFSDLFSRGKGPIAPAGLNNWLTKIGRFVKPLLRPYPNILKFARVHNPQSVCINPSEVFGYGKLSQKGKVELVVWLDRIQGRSTPEFLQADASLSSRIIRSTISEFDPWCVRLSNVAMASGIILFKQLYSSWKKVIWEGLKDTPQYILNLPIDLPMGDVSRTVRDVLFRNGLLKDL